MKKSSKKKSSKPIQSIPVISKPTKSKSIKSKRGESKRFASKPIRSKANSVASQIFAGLENAGRKTKTGPNFYDKVYIIVEQIPMGKVTTYGAIAETLGMKGSSRMVGHALNAIPEGSDLPAQRVINRIGALSGAHHFGGFERMKRMLVREGVTFKKELVNMDLHFWHPKELEKY